MRAMYPCNRSFFPLQHMAEVCRALKRSVSLLSEMESASDLVLSLPLSHPLIFSLNPELYTPHPTP